MLLVLSFAVNIGPLSATIVMQFPKPVRYSGVAIGLGVSQMIFGAPSTALPFELEWRYGRIFIGYYISAHALLSALAVAYLRETEPQTSVLSPSPSSNALVMA